MDVFNNHYASLLEDNIEEDNKYEKKKFNFAKKKAYVRQLILSNRRNIIYVLSMALISFFIVSLSFYWFFFKLNVTDGSADILPPYNPIDSEPSDILQWTEPMIKRAFDRFTREYNKVYSGNVEVQNRYNIFKKNLYYIHTHNDQGFSYKLQMNQFGDLTNEEFKKMYLGYKPNNARRSLGVNLNLLNDEDLPESINWNDHNCVTPVKDQKSCGSCWAFSSTGSLEGAYCAKTGKLLNLSEQQLVDCSKSLGNEGCNGGEMDFAFQYVIENGLCTEESYPYTFKDGECAAKNCTSVIQIHGFKDVPHDSEKALMAGLKTNPVSVGIQADQLPFQFYHEGVFSADCGNELNHGVLAIGYGTDTKSGKDFWIIKNSWGSKWGESGFMRLARHKGSKGECGILMGASYPIV